jgi:NTE family protein
MNDGIFVKNKALTALALISLLLLGILAGGCTHFGHYPVNEPLSKYEPGYGYIPRNVVSADKSEELLLILSFSGGGTRAAAFSYGVLEELRATQVTLDGRERSLLSEVDLISAVSGGSFTAAYYGLFGDRIFKDFESRFLKKNIQGALSARVLLNPVNWFRLSSPFFDRSDLAAEYYNKHVFDGKNFGDFLERKGPMILINATDMSKGTRMSFNQVFFDIICSDLSKFPVGRACAASSAVPGLLSPVTLKNYAGSCGSVLPPQFEKLSPTYRQREIRENVMPILDSKEKPYLHLIDGGVADNLGLRAIEEIVSAVGDLWTTLKLTRSGRVHKVAFIIVNAEKKIDDQWDKIEFVPPFSAMLSNYSSIAITRYNRETVALLEESFEAWAREIREGRCPPGQISTAPGSCGDIEFYLAEVRFQDLEDPEERSYLNKLPTSFRLKPEEVDKLRDAAHRLLRKSEDFQRLLRDLEK